MDGIGGGLIPMLILPSTSCRVYGISGGRPMLISKVVVYTNSANLRAYGPTGLPLWRTLWAPIGPAGPTGLRGPSVASPPDPTGPTGAGSGRPRPGPYKRALLVLHAHRT